MKTKSRLLAACAVVLVVGSVAVACSIPVFRYALERWALSPYEVIVFHRGPLAKDVRTALEKWDEPQKVNLKLVPVDVDRKMSKDHQRLWTSLGDQTTLPYAVIRVADGDEKAPPVWSGPVPDADRMLNLADSPLRQKLIARLSKGETATFIYVESGMKDEDDKTVAMMEKELARLEKAVKLPDQSAEGPQLKTNLPLKAGFSVLRLSRQDKAEDGFLRVLLGTEEDLDKVKGPLAFPVFGRGRALCSLYDRDLNEKQLANVVRFLCGECSCQVKELNPGVDLLLMADWGAILDKIGPPPGFVPKDDPPPMKKKKG